MVPPRTRFNSIGFIFWINLSAESTRIVFLCQKEFVGSSSNINQNLVHQLFSTNTSNRRIYIFRRKSCAIYYNIRINQCEHSEFLYCIPIENLKLNLVEKRRNKSRFEFRDHNQKSYF